MLRTALTFYSIMNRGRLLGNFVQEPRSRGVFFGGGAKKPRVFGVRGKLTKRGRRFTTRRIPTKATPIKAAVPTTKAHPQDGSLLTSIKTMVKSGVHSVGRTLKRQGKRAVRRGVKQATKEGKALVREGVKSGLRKLSKGAAKTVAKANLPKSIQRIGQASLDTAATSPTPSKRRQPVRRRRRAPRRYPLQSNPIKTVIGGGAPLF